MNLKKAIRKVAAVGAGLTMVGATLMGAMAANLNEYPSPFVQDGVFDAVLIVGDGAAAADVVGVTDIAMALQYGMTTTEFVAGETTTTEFSEGALLRKSGNEVVLLEAIGSSESKLDADELPEVLSENVEFIDTENDEFEYDEFIWIGAGTSVMTYGLTEDSDYNDFPVLYLDTGATNAASVPNFLYRTEIDIAEMNTTRAVGKEIELFGNTYTFSTSTSDLSNSKLTFHQSSNKATIGVGESLELGGVTIEVIGANAEDSTATISVDGDTEQVSEDDEVKIGDVSVFIDDVFMQTIPTSSAMVEVSVSSGDIIFESTKRVKIGGEWIDGTYVLINGTAPDRIDGVFISVFPADQDDKIYYMEEGDEFIDPVFGTFKVVYADTVNGFDDARDTIKFKQGDAGTNAYINLEFTNKADQEYEVELWSLDTNDAIGTGLTLNNSDSDIDVKTAANIGDDDYFVVNVGSDPTYTHILQFEDFDVEGEDDDDVDIIDLATGEDVANWESNTSITLKLEEDATLTVNAAGTITACAACHDTIYTKGNVMFNITPKDNVSTSYDGWTLTEDAEGDDFEYETTLKVYPTYHDTDEVALIKLATATIGNDDAEDSNLTVSGTLSTVDDEDSDYTEVVISTPLDEMYFNIYVAPTEAVATTATSGTETTVIEQIEVGATKLASEVDVLASNAIVVGGPCINAAAATLMGNPEVCGEGFVPGEAMIKLFENEGKVAMLVAGYEAEDTRTACKLVADGSLADIDGMEAVVVSASETVTAPVVVVEE